MLFLFIRASSILFLLHAGLGQSVKPGDTCLISIGNTITYISLRIQEMVHYLFILYVLTHETAIKTDISSFISENPSVGKINCLKTISNYLRNLNNIGKFQENHHLVD